MSKELKVLENALRKMRVDFPSLLQGECDPAAVLQEISASEKRREDFEEVYEMLSAGMQPLIRANTDALKDSVVEYHAMHRALQSSQLGLEDAAEQLQLVCRALEAPETQGRLEELRRESERAEKERKEALTKQALAVDVLTAADVYAGRLEQIAAHLKRVEPESAREEVKKRTEAGVWRLKKDVEKKIAAKMERGEELSPVDVAAYGMAGGSVLAALQRAVQAALVAAINRAAARIK